MGVRVGAAARVAVRAALALGVAAALTSCGGSSASKLAAAEQQIQKLDEEVLKNFAPDEMRGLTS